MTFPCWDLHDEAWSWVIRLWILPGLDCQFVANCKAAQNTDPELRNCLDLPNPTCFSASVPTATDPREKKTQKKPFSPPAWLLGFATNCDRPSRNKTTTHLHPSQFHCRSTPD